jgi:hypothetical protein
MFSVAQKRHIAETVEKALLELKHPEMPTEKPRFHLHVDGAESWSWADIEPNWTFDDNHAPGVNPFNEAVAASMERKAGSSE